MTSTKGAEAPLPGSDARLAAIRRLLLDETLAPVAALLRQHLRDRSNMTTAANPASSWLFPGQLAGEHRSYRRLVRVLHQLGIPARVTRLATWRELARQAPLAVLADALGVSPGTAMRHAFLGGADWSAYAARRRAHSPDDKTSQAIAFGTGTKCPPLRAGQIACDGSQARRKGVVLLLVPAPGPR